MSATAEISEDKGSHIWTLLPTFDPAVDNVKEYIEKVKFIDSICPKKDRPMLAPRLAMLCRGTAWGQVKSLESSALTDPENGVKSLLAALSSWEESTEMKTYEQFEKAVYRTVQKSDESSMSYVNRLQVAMDELGAKSLKEFHAFLLLRQSVLSPEDKKRVLTMTNGDMDTKKIEQSMRTLATNILSSGENRKKVYPTNFVEPEVGFVATDQDGSSGAGMNNYYTEDDEVDQELVEHLAAQGDSDALNVVAFERDLEEMFQEVPDLHQALVNYQEARTKILERKRSRGFWPSTGKGKMKGAGKFQPRKGSGKGNLLQRVARTFCKACGEKGHWKAECPNKAGASTDSVNYVIHQSFQVIDREDGPAQVIFEDADEAGSEERDHVPRGNNQRGKNEVTWNGIMLGIIRRVGNAAKHAAEGCIRAMSAVSRPMSSSDKSHKPIMYDPPTEVAFSMQHLIPEVQKFLGPRLHSRKPAMPTAVECYHSRPDLSRTAQEGLAILDTGASRSVIGAELWPGVLKSLPSEVRHQVKEVPSRVGFRFGNNQITYSFKQVRIPILIGKRRIWIVIEVVPHATPFLISIQALKALGAMINLSTNQCFLSKINRELNLQESENGLYVIRMSELCVDPCETAMNVETSKAVQVPNICPPPGLFSPEPADHADSEGRNAADQDHGRSSDGITSDAAHHPDEPDRSESPGPRDLRPPCQLTAVPSGTCVQPEGKDRRTRRGSQSNQVPSQVSGKRWAKAVRAWRPLGFLMGAGGRGTDGVNDNSLKEDCPKGDANQCDTPESSSPAGSGADQREPAGVDGSGSGELGEQENLVGKDAQWEGIRGGLRGKQQLCRLDHSKGKECDTSHAGLHHLLPSSRRHGKPGSEKSPIESRPLEQILFLEDAYEMKLMKSCRHHMPKGNTKQIDLLEVYASPQSKLTDEVNKRGGTAKRFTMEDGDLRTFEGQLKLLKKVFLWKPKHVWMAPECAPWCPWNRFNQMRGVSSFCRIQDNQERSREQLTFCSLVCKIQLDRGDHFHLENPGPSGMWHQNEMQEICSSTKPAYFDQCRFGLKHPCLQEPMQKRTRVQTSSEEMFQSMDSRFCQHDHEHVPIAGNCSYKGQNIQVSRFAAFYPRVLAKKLAEVIMRPKHSHVVAPIFMIDQECLPVRSLDDADKLLESSPKRMKKTTDENTKKNNRKRPLELNEQQKIDDPQWKELMNRYRKELPKSGVVRWEGNQNSKVQAIQKLCPEMQVQSVMAGKGREKYVVHPDQLPFRRTIILSRLAYEVFDLGTEDLQEMSKNQQSRKAEISAHIMVCVFGRPSEAIESNDSQTHETNAEENSSRVPSAELQEPSAMVPSNGKMFADSVSDVQLPANSWTSAAVSVSGPRYLKLSEQRKSYIRKLHHNLGHPTAERLSKHLADLGAEELLVQGALDYLCAPCAERRPPRLNPTGTLKEARDFNQRIYIDGFDWKGEHGSGLCRSHHR